MTVTDGTPPPIAVVGLVGGECFGVTARRDIDDAEVIVGSERQLRLAAPPDGATVITLRGPLEATIDAIDDHRRTGARVCVVASGDPGFFGIVRALGQRFGQASLRVSPAPSSVTLAFGRLGSAWDDAVVVSAHGRPLQDAADQVLTASKAAVFTSPDHPPEALGAALLARAIGPRSVAVLSRLGEPEESVFRGDVDTLAAGRFDPMSIVILESPVPEVSSPTLVWGRAAGEFAHRDGMITKAEVRAVTLGKLALPQRGVMWDVGAGSGSIAIEAACLCPELTVIAIEHDAESVARIKANAAAHGANIEVVHGRAPDALEGLPIPDRVFVGGGGTVVLDAAWQRLRPDGVVVANYALLDRAVVAWRKLGNMVELQVARGTAVGEHGVRLAAENPVFVCWGTR